MHFRDVNPFIRFAESFHYQSQGDLFQVMDCRLFYTISGKADFYIDEEHFELLPDSIFYCCRGKQYRIASEGIQMIVLNFDLDQSEHTHTGIYPRIQVKPFQTLPQLEHSHIEDSEYLNNYFFLSHAKDFLVPLENILNEFSAKLVCYQENSSGILKCILTRLHRQSLEGSVNASDAVSRIFAYIRENFDKEITNEILSEMSGYHEYHLNRLFMKHSGLTVHKYVLSVRINEAKKMLLNTDLSLTDISEKVGFHSNTHFSSYFKQFVGISPLKFRKEYKNKL